MWSSTAGLCIEQSIDTTASGHNIDPRAKSHNFLPMERRARQYEPSSEGRVCLGSRAESMASAMRRPTNDVVQIPILRLGDFQ